VPAIYVDWVWQQYRASAGRLLEELRTWDEISCAAEQLYAERRGFA